MNDNKLMENCQICGNELDYFDNGKELCCEICEKIEIGNIYCDKGHYVCNECHDKSAFDIVQDYGLTTKSKDPFEIAEMLMSIKDKVPMLGCANAWIATVSLMAALKNEGTIQVSNEQIIEALNRTNRQAIGGYCGLTGVCGIVPAIGASFSVILGAACKKDQETAKTMKIVGKIVNVIADETGPCCCKNFVRTALLEAMKLAKDELGVKWIVTGNNITCTHSERHPHGCRKNKCRYFNFVNFN